MHIARSRGIEARKMGRERGGGGKEGEQWKWIVGEREARDYADTSRSARSTSKYDVRE